MCDDEDVMYDVVAEECDGEIGPFTDLRGDDALDLIELEIFDCVSARYYVFEVFEFVVHTTVVDFKRHFGDNAVERLETRAEFDVALLNRTASDFDLFQYATTDDLG